MKEIKNKMTIKNLKILKQLEKDFTNQTKETRILLDRL